MDEENKQEQAKSRDLNMYSSIKIGRKTLADATLNLDAIRVGNMRYGDKQYSDKKFVIDALARNDARTLRAISNYFYRTNGIYQRVCNYFANLYRYDWYIVPEIYDTDAVNENRMNSSLVKLLSLLDSSYIAKTCQDIAMGVIKNGAYYGYISGEDESIILQELPIEYCRSIYNVDNLPAVEFNVAYFDNMYTSTVYKQKVLKLFPTEIQEGYSLYKQGKLTNEFPSSLSNNGRNIHGIVSNAWYPLDPKYTVKFSFSSGRSAMTDLPLFIDSIPALIDLDEAEGLERKRQAQQLARILVQKLPLDKNSDLVFDVDEAKDIHANAVSMLQNTVGVDVLTTFTDVEDIDLSDSSEAASEAVETAADAVYRSMGVTENLFNTDGNLSTEKSVLVDEATVRTLILQFEIFFDRVIRRKYNTANWKFRFYMLETTQFNYQTISDKYKAQSQIGHSKLLSQIALGHSMSSILNMAYFENNVLHLSELMIPPLQSSVMSAEVIQALGKGNQTTENSSQDNTGEESQVGRPEKAESEKSDKTLANLESQS